MSESGNLADMIEAVEKELRKLKRGYIALEVIGNEATKKKEELDQILVKLNRIKPQELEELVEDLKGKEGIDIIKSEEYETTNIELEFDEVFNEAIPGYTPFYKGIKDITSMITNNNEETLNELFSKYSKTYKTAIFTLTKFCLSEIDKEGEFRPTKEIIQETLERYELDKEEYIPFVLDVLRKYQNVSAKTIKNELMRRVKQPIELETADKYLNATREIILKSIKLNY